MGAIGGLLGTAGGVSGTGIQGPSSAPIVNPTNADQLSAAYTGTQGAMGGQQALLTALQGQNGLQNQSNVYNQMQGVANGTGPNPAQAMLSQATGANVANQAALMAGQRGAGANVGLMARQAAQQGAATQQQAAGQGATMQANQSLNALNSAGQMAGNMAANQIGQTNANTQAQQANQQALLGAAGNFNSAVQSGQSSINSANAGLAGTQMQGQQGLIGGLMNSAGAAFGMADGGDVAPQTAFAGPQSRFGQFLASSQQVAPAEQGASSQLGSNAGADALKKGSGSLGGIGGGASKGKSMAGGADASDLMGAMTMVAAKGGNVPAMVSPGEVYLDPREVERVKQGANPMKVGEKIGGKPAVGGTKNSYANDTVSKDLESGGVVVPRSETQSKNPERNSAEFVAKVLARRGSKSQ